jgi:hypothetical protein
MVRVGSGRTVRQWEAGKREIPGPATVIIETAVDVLRERDAIVRELELLEAGQIHSQMSRGARMEDSTPQNVARLRDAKASLEAALAILTA